MIAFLGCRYKNKCFPHGDRMAPFVFLQVPSTLGLQSAKNGCYSETCIATFHSVLPCHMRSYKRLHNFSRQCPCSTWFPAYFSSIMLPSLAYLQCVCQNLCRQIRSTWKVADQDWLSFSVFIQEDQQCQKTEVMIVKMLWLAVTTHRIDREKSVLQLSLLRTKKLKSGCFSSMLSASVRFMGPWYHLDGGGEREGG